MKEATKAFVAGDLAKLDRIWQRTDPEGYTAAMADMESEMTLRGASRDQVAAEALALDPIAERLFPDVVAEIRRSLLGDDG
jgi:hypothetical protein